MKSKPVSRQMKGASGMAVAGAIILVAFSLLVNCTNERNPGLAAMKTAFASPAKEYQPGVYWYFMDGNMSEEGITKDLESMASVGIGNVVFLEVNVGIPRGEVEFLSERWQELFLHAERQADRLGIDITLGIGPGWTGSGGPWVHPEESMQHLIFSETRIAGPSSGEIKLSKPAPLKPYFGDESLTPELKKIRYAFYEDVAVLAFPTPVQPRIRDIQEKALYYRGPYSSVPGIRPFFAQPQVDTTSHPEGLKPENILDITNLLQGDHLVGWKVPDGNWTILRFGRSNNGAVTRPAPFPGLGFESDKFDTVALANHLHEFPGKLLEKIGRRDPAKTGGLKMLHMDSWEMGSQNWTGSFRKEFTVRRGYDPLLYFPVYAGYVEGSADISERFLWDLRLTSQELIVENHAQYVRRYAEKFGLGLSIEPYDMNPTADLELGAVADVPMSEFWSKGYGFNTVYSCMEAASIGHLQGHATIAAEAFTAEKDGWKQYPGSMKNQSDWAFATGINKFVIHTFQHQPFDDQVKPGMTMGPYGVHWDRNQTWWPMASAYHQYVARCQFMLRQGTPVADILYLTPEGAPQIFLPPGSALGGDALLPDKLGYSFDGCWPSQLFQASVKDGSIVFAGGAKYAVLVLPAVGSISEKLLTKIQSLAADGATVVGNPFLRSQGLTGYPESDWKVRAFAKEMWGTLEIPSGLKERKYGKGRIFYGTSLGARDTVELFPDYEIVRGILGESGLAENFKSDGSLRYAHHTHEFWDMYFVSNTSDRKVKTECLFRTAGGSPEWWNPVTGETRSLTSFTKKAGQVMVPLAFDSYESGFIVFDKESNRNPEDKPNFEEQKTVETLEGPWQVFFDTLWGGPERVTFDQLEDWSTRKEPGIKYYSGIATYTRSFTVPPEYLERKDISLDLGVVKNMARVLVNGKDVGIVWTAPWRVNISGTLNRGDNKLEIQVANLWPNRLIGDAADQETGFTDGKWDKGLFDGHRKGSAFSFSTYYPYTKDSALLPSGLLGPVVVMVNGKRRGKG